MVSAPSFCLLGLANDIRLLILFAVTTGYARRVRNAWKTGGRKKLLLCAAGLAVVAGSVTLGVLRVTEVYAQTVTVHSSIDLSGIWQGVLATPGDRDFRIVYKITKTGAGWSAVSYSIDQTPNPIPVSSITLDGTEVKMSIPRMLGHYEGKISPDGSTIRGTWTQAKPVPLVLTRVAPEAAWPIPEPPPRPKPMAADADPEFEVATIKPSKPDPLAKAYYRSRGTRFSSANTTLADLLSVAYHLNKRQLIGLPSWAVSDRFDVDGQPDREGIPSEAQRDAMLQKLLSDRFKVRFHEEQREVPCYALTVARSGYKMTPSKDDPNKEFLLGFRGAGNLFAAKTDMTEFVALLEGALFDRPVIDRTGLKGKFDFDLKWTPDSAASAGAGGELSQPSDLFAAMRQQLGLKLDSTKAPLRVLVFDEVQRPSAN